MARRFLTVVLVIFVVLIGLILFMPRSNQRGQAARLLGFTNGVVGPIVPMFGTLSESAQSMQRWFAAGTNGAVFSITNSESCTISVLPVARFYYRSGLGTNSVETPLLNAPNDLGTFLTPGQAATVQVAVLEHHGQWKVVFLYHRRDQGLLKGLMGALAKLIARLCGAPTGRQNGAIESDWIMP